jgi:hypothetical protein
MLALFYGFGNIAEKQRLSFHYTMKTMEIFKFFENGDHERPL